MATKAGGGAKRSAKSNIAKAKRGLALGQKAVGTAIGNKLPVKTVKIQKPKGVTLGAKIAGGMNDHKKRNQDAMDAASGKKKKGTR